VQLSKFDDAKAAHARAWRWLARGYSEYGDPSSRLLQPPLLDRSRVTIARQGLLLQIKPMVHSLVQLRQYPADP